VVNTEEGVESIGPVLSPKLSGLFRPIEQLGLRLTLGRGFKAPTVQELYEYRNHLGKYWRLGNPDLEPEYSWNGALGVEVAPFEFLNININGYANYLQDMIVISKVTDPSLIIGNKDTYMRRNLDEGLIGGLDAQTSFVYDSDFYGARFDIGGAYVAHASNDDSLRIPYYPGTTGFLRLTGRFSLPGIFDFVPFVGYNAAVGREVWSYTVKEGESQTTELEDLHNVEAGFSFDILNRFGIYFRGSNLLGQERETYEDLILVTEGKARFEGGIEIDIQ
jgi:outer membrane receptor protein involved in Fe transport